MDSFVFQKTFQLLRVHIEPGLLNGIEQAMVPKLRVPLVKRTYLIFRCLID